MKSKTVHFFWKIKGYGAWTVRLACRPYKIENPSKNMQKSRYWKYVTCKKCLYK